MHGGLGVECPYSFKATVRTISSSSAAEEVALSPCLGSSTATAERGFEAKRDLLTPSTTSRGSPTTTSQIPCLSSNGPLNASVEVQSMRQHATAVKSQGQMDTLAQKKGPAGSVSCHPMGRCLLEFKDGGPKGHGSSKTYAGSMSAPLRHVSKQSEPHLCVAPPIKIGS